MQKTILIIAAILGVLSVAIGAFGAHGLRHLLEQNQRTGTFETAVQYQFYHTLALLAIGVLMSRFSSIYLVYAAFAMIAGIFFFSGSLYALSVTNVGKWGMVAPIGGLLFIAGWVLIVIGLIKDA